MEITIYTIEVECDGARRHVNPVHFSGLDQNEFNLLAELVGSSPSHDWE